MAWFSFGTVDIGDELAIIKRQNADLKAQNTEILKIVRTIMADVKIAQADLDATAAKLRELVTQLNSADLTKLDPADQSGIVTALTDLTDAVNKATGPKTPDVPAPNPDPGPTETPTETPADGGDQPTEQPSE